jgi:hypothetical protein
VEKNQYDLCLEVIRRLAGAGVLSDALIIGSWCLPFYAEYFKGVAYHPTLRTRDIDFLIPQPKKMHAKADVPALLKDLGFIRDLVGDAGYIRLISPDLIVEFLVPEIGRGSDKPVALPKLGINAQPLRFLGFLAQNPITTHAGSIPIRLPNPIHFALHKLIIASRRSKVEKTEKDRREGIYILTAIIKKGEVVDIQKVFKHLPPKWRKAIVNEMKAGQAGDILIQISPNPV